MEKLRLTILSFACCNPSLAVHDKRYVEVIKEAASRAGVEYEIDIAHATEARMLPHYSFMDEIMPLFQKYGQAVSPALFINRSLQLYGGVPTVGEADRSVRKNPNSQWSKDAYRCSIPQLSAPWPVDGGAGFLPLLLSF